MATQRNREKTEIPDIMCPSKTDVDNLIIQNHKHFRYVNESLRLIILSFTEIKLNEFCSKFI